MSRPTEPTVQVSDDLPGRPSCDASGANAGSADPVAKLSWWWSRDEERFYGPCSGRADAIMEAWAEDAEQGAFICQASQGEWRTDIIEEDWLAEAFDDANDEQSDPDGDGPSTLLDGVAWKKLAGRMNQLVRQAIRETGLRAWGFSNQHPSEWVDIPAAAASMAGARALLDALERISAATPGNTNSATIAQFQSWVSAVADTAIADAMDPHPAPSSAATGNSGMNNSTNSEA